MIQTLEVAVHRQGLHPITSAIQSMVQRSGIDNGLCTVFIQHTSASLLIQENADPTARHDLEQWFNRLVPEDDSLYSHTLEGSDDMPAHIKAALTATSLSIPILHGTLALGTWQGLWLWEHRHHPGNRTLIIHMGA
jgi:secondary thiamine-phosphate synthase enzyme